MRIGIIGTGLIGGSLGMALRRKPGYYIYCWNRKVENSKKAVKLKAADRYFETIDELAENSDIIIIATPLGTYKDICKKLGKHLDGKKIISDVGSVKFEPTEIARAQFPSKYTSFFVPAHPIAGKEKGGIENADANLYKGKKVIICKTPVCKKGKVISKIWKDAGAEIELLNVAKHDEIYAYVSHFVQYLSFACSKHMPKTLGDFSRLMNSPKEIWAEIFQYNGKNIQKVKAQFIRELERNIKNLKPVKAKDKFTATSQIIAQTLIDIVPSEYRKYAGTGYKSFTSAANGAKAGAQIKPSEVKEILTYILKELKK